MSFDAETDARMAAARVRAREAIARKKLLRAQRARPKHTEPRYEVEVHPEPYDGPIHCPRMRTEGEAFLNDSAVNSGRG